MPGSWDDPLHLAPQTSNTSRRKVSPRALDRSRGAGGPRALNRGSYVGQETLHRIFVLRRRGIEPFAVPCAGQYHLLFQRARRVGIEGAGIGGWHALVTLDGNE